MSKLLRLSGGLLLTLLLLVIALLVLLRFRPDSAVWAANKLLTDTEINTDGLALTYFPPSLDLKAANIRLPDQAIDVKNASARFDASAWQSDAPYWSVTADSVLIDSTPPLTPEPAGPVNVAIPNLAPFLTFTRLNVDQLEMTGESPLTASLKADRENESTQINASVTLSGQKYVVTGTIKSPATGPMPFNFQVAGSENEAGETLTASLGGLLSQADGTELKFDSGTASISAAEGEQKLEQLQGNVRISNSGNEVEITNLRGQITSWDAGLENEPVELSATTKFLTDNVSVKANGSLGQSTIELALTLINQTGALSGQLSLASKGLPSGIEYAPFTSEQLFPATLETGFALADGSLNLSKLQLDTPRNALKGSAEVSTAPPWKLLADINASKLFFPLVDENPEDSDPDETAEAEEVVTSAEQIAADDVPEPAPVAQNDRVFSDEAMDWSWLSSAEINLKLVAQELALQDAAFTDLKVGVKNNSGELKLDPLSASLGDGGFTGSSTLKLLSPPSVNDQSQTEGSASIAAADRVALEALFKMSGVALESFGLVPTEELSGGKVEADIALSTEGNTQAELAGGLNGEILLMVEEAKLMNDFIELAGSDLVMETLNKLNPFAKNDPTTDLSCALVRFTAENGKLTTKNQLVMETSKMEIVGTGDINLVDEKISLGITPNAKSGVGVNVGSAVKFMKLGGTLSAPRPAVSAGGLLKSGLAIGAAISTGGASVVAEGLAKRALNAGSACEAVRKNKSESSEDTDEA